MKQITITDVIGALCSDDHKGPNRQYVEQGKVVIVECMGRIPIRGIPKVLESRTATVFRRKYGGGTESIVTEEKAVDVRNSMENDINGALQSMASNNLNSNNVVRQQYMVRRLTPLECERLQGLPDGWTYLPNEKSCSDSARYKAIGNGMAQPCADWIIKRIVEEVGNAEMETEQTDA